MPVMTGKTARLAVAAGPEAAERYNSFIRTLGFIHSSEAHKLIVAGDEIIDNLLTHGETGRNGLHVLVHRQRHSLTLAFFIDSHRQFADFSYRFSRGVIPAPYYDADSRRWRGMGLVMCSNLARQVVYRPGLVSDRIWLTFPAETP